nr:DUF2516 family protein [Williamsia sp. CHRR-6]
MISILVYVLWLAGGAAALAALVHAAITRPDAFPAVDRQSKVMWVSILAVATLLIGLTGVISFFGIFGVVAVLVYIVDVRPRIDAILGRKWFRKV